MRSLFVFLMSLAAIGTAMAQNKIDFAGRTLPDDTTKTYSVIVELSGKDAGFGDCKVDVVSRLGAMAIVNANVKQIDEMAALPQVVQISVGQENKLYDEPAGAPTAIELVRTCVDSLDYTPVESRDDARLTKVVLNLCRRCKAQTAK